MERSLTLIFILILVLYFSKQVYALKINEIYPAPPSGQPEWVEIYNDEDKTIDLTKYTITDAKNNKLTFESPIASQSSFILATSDNVLNNSGGDSVILKDESGQVVDRINYTDTFSNNQSYIRCPDGGESWFLTTTQTKKNSNTEACNIPTATSVPTPTPTVTTAPILPSDTPELIRYDNIYISEAMTDPESGGNEWVELYNDNNFSVSLKGWFIDDSPDTGSSPKNFNLDIGPKGYATYNLATAMLNNGEDFVRLIDPYGEEKDSFQYYSSIKGKTWGKLSPSGQEVCLQEPSKNAVNYSCIELSTTLYLTPTARASPTKSPAVSLTGQIPTAFPTSKAVPTIKTKKSPIPTVILPEYLFHASSEASISAIPKKRLGEVLGTKTSSSQKKHDLLPVWKILSVISTVLSILTIGTVLVRMRNRYD